MRKNIWSELESNPGPLVSQATTLTTKPWLLGPRRGSWIAAEILAEAHLKHGLVVDPPVDLVEDLGGVLSGTFHQFVETTLKIIVSVK